MYISNLQFSFLPEEQESPRLQSWMRNLAKPCSRSSACWGGGAGAQRDTEGGRNVG